MLYEKQVEIGMTKKVHSFAEFLDWISEETDGVYPNCTYIPIVNTLLCLVSLAGVMAIYFCEFADYIETKIRKILKK